MARVTTGRILALEGPSGVGKSTLARYLEAASAGVALPEAFDRLGRRLDLSVDTFARLRRVERALLQEEGRRYRWALRRTRNGTWVIADTGFLGPVTYSFGLFRTGLRPWDLAPSLLVELEKETLRGRWGLPDAVVILRATPHELNRRAQASIEEHPPELVRRHAIVFEEERALFQATYGEAFPGRIQIVNAGRPVDEVAREILAWTKKVSRFAPLDREAVIAVLTRLRERTATPGGGSSLPETESL